MDYNDCVLSKIYIQRSHTIELNELLKEIDYRKREISLLQESVNELRVQKENGKKEVATLDKEIKILDGKATRIRARDFLITSIGRENYFSYKNNGYFDVKGTNNSIYRITNEGVISKIKVKEDFVYRIKSSIVNVLLNSCCPKIKTATSVGEIESTNYPLEDSIAIVYMNIVKDSDRFDIDKACGRISINRV
jgi:hypothetical protein